MSYLVVAPQELGQFGMFDFKRFDAIYNVGLEYARQVLQETPEPVEA